MSDNPFSEPEEDRTIIRPKPGGRRGGAAAPPAARPANEAPAARAAEAAPAAEDHAPPPPIFAIGGNLLAAAAEPLVLLLARLWNAPTRPFSGDLRASTMNALRVFEQRAREAGVPMELLRPAHYALCASIDDVVLNTPWGKSAGWDAGTLAASFHQEARSGEKFFDQLAQLCRNPGKLLPAIELMYVCLSLGFMGPYRRAPDGIEAVEQVRRKTHDFIRAQRPAAEPGLSAQWRGVAAPYVPGKARFPVWVVLSAALAIAGGLFAWCLVTLDSESDGVYAKMLAAPPASMPAITRAAIIVPPAPPPAPPEPTALDRLRGALQPETDKGALVVLGTPTTVVLRIGTDKMFSAGSANLQPAALPLLQRVAAVLKDELAGGSLQVVGYTDDQPTRTVKFPSNFKLSAARAEAVRDVLQRALGKTPVIAADGRADADPVAANASPEGREQNRRIEILLRRQP